MDIEKKSGETGKSLAGFVRHLRAEKNASEHTVAAYFANIVEFAVRVRQSDAAFDDWASVDVEQARSLVMAL